jgi:hypothetical protein
MQGVFNQMPGSEIKIDIVGLAVLPVDYLPGDGVSCERICAIHAVDAPYQAVFTAGIRGYQLSTYLDLVLQHYGGNVARKVRSVQRWLLNNEPGAGQHTVRAVELIEAALNSQTVEADTARGRIDIPIEMNVALALLLGMPVSPDYVEAADQQADQITRMQPEIDWTLSQCLSRSGKEMLDTFSPLLACIGPDEDITRAMNSVLHA